MSKYYIAYGSNLSRFQMSYRCPNAKIIGTGILKDWQLVFRKYASVLPNKKKFYVPVLVWSISDRDERNLDRFEGFPKSYIKKYESVRVTSLKGEDLGEITGMIYIMTSEAIKKRSFISVPHIDYYSVLYSSYKEFGFDTEILKAALEQSKLETIRNAPELKTEL